MGKTITNEPDVSAARKRVGELASDMLKERISFIEGARELSSLRFDAAADENDVDFMVFVGIDSESDHLPIGDQKKLWSSESLLKLQPEIDETVDWAKRVGKDACISLSKRFGA